MTGFRISGVNPSGSSINKRDDPLKLLRVGNHMEEEFCAYRVHI
jgi:uncharacterized cupin superfamily protein